MTVVPASAAELRAAYNQLYAHSTLKESADYYAWIVRLLALQPGERLLDVGCGEGRLLDASASAGAAAAVGVDFSENALRLAHRHLRQPAVCVAEAEHVPLPSGCADCVACLGSLEHFSDPGAALREMARLVRPAGRLLIVVPNSFFVLDILNAWWRGKGPNHGQPLERFAALGEWRALLEQHGLRVTAVKKHNTRSAFSNWAFQLAWAIARPFMPLSMSYQFVFLCVLAR